MLRQAIEMSRADSGPANPNPDELTYEELLQLEEANGGAVSKGLT